MFSVQGLFRSVACPESPSCKRPHCLFSHSTDHRTYTPLHIPLPDPNLKPTPSSSSTTIPAKRQSIPTSSSAPSSPLREPPRKLQKLAHAPKPAAVPTAQRTSNGVPLLRVSAAQSQVAVPVRQAMLKTIYEHFVVLYAPILDSNPNLAADHALRQEEEVYKNSNKLTYRNAVIHSVAALKKRPPPDSPSHPSVGTDADLAARAESRRSLDALRLTRAHLEPLVLSLDALRKWGFMTDVPPGPGGERPSEEGRVATCERCRQPFVVRAPAPHTADECMYHWGKLYSRRINGERMRVYTCCARPEATSEGCTRGSHVFYESDPAALHSRHPFSFLRGGKPPPPPPPPDNEEAATAPSSPSQAREEEQEDAAREEDTALDVVAVDCEMVYTTGGMRVARVSVVDGGGAQIFDELVRMDDGVEVIDYNTRFSGITPESHAGAVLALAGVRRALDALVCAETIVVGHALENDLRTLRAVHLRVVDTAVLFPHRAGAPYRRALRELAREHLGADIQRGGGHTGHSSVEDAAATLDLVKWYVMNNGSRPPPESGSGAGKGKGKEKEADKGLEKGMVPGGSAVPRDGGT